MTFYIHNIQTLLKSKIKEYKFNQHKLCKTTKNRTWSICLICIYWAYVLRDFGPLVSSCSGVSSLITFFWGFLVLIFGFGSWYPMLFFSFLDCEYLAFVISDNEWLLFDFLGLLLLLYFLFRVAYDLKTIWISCFHHSIAIGATYF